MDTQKITTVKVKMDTKSSLDKLKVIERESYDEVIQRLIQSSSPAQSKSDFQVKKTIPEKTQNAKEEKVIPEKIQGVKEGKTKFFESILKPKGGNKKEEKVSSHFSYP